MFRSLLVYKRAGSQVTGAGAHDDPRRENGVMRAIKHVVGNMRPHDQDWRRVRCKSQHSLILLQRNDRVAGISTGSEFEGGG